MQGLRAQVAKASRIWVEGKHDAELVEKVRGDDQRSERVVVEPLGGIDDLESIVRTFAPAPDARCVRSRSACADISSAVAASCSAAGAWGRAAPGCARR